ncbi:MAG: thioredoxin domain-containing protein [Bacteroidia bacterium]|nr:thioredoxin domain-containing protein [Bacteroidia bacterium]
MYRFTLLSLLLLLIGCATPTRKTGEPSLNRLAESNSPYLRQHATNPVDWYPWGEEAFEKAKQEDKLVIISVGYSACHWCHVMEKESFTDSAVAAFMNEHFVSIKVDREQRPDIDQVYLNAAMLTTGRGGWPLNAIALPDGSPIVAATYFAPEEWIDLLQKVLNLRTQSPEQLASMAARVAEGVAQMERSPFLPDAPKLDFATSQDAANSILPSIDPQWGGFQGAPKFPMPDVFRFLLAYGHAAGEKQATTAVTNTLTHMAKGGIYDHVGGGFARYAIDSIWHVPHFEKMLYDNAQLLALYAEAYRATGDEAYRSIVAETVGFLQRELTDASGGLYSSLDADSDGEEGAFYVWSEKEFLKTLGMKAKAFKDYYHVLPQGNWEEDRNVLMVIEDPAVIAQRHGYTEREFRYMIPVANRLLLEQRSKRERPRRDDKILTGWNALMMSGYVEAYRAFGDDSLLSAARGIADFLLGNMKRSDGGLYRSYFEGKAEIPAFADDYGFLIEALVDLYQVTFEEKWLREAERLMQVVQENFRDEANPYFFFTEKNGETLIARPKDVEDNVTPSANASLARGLFLLGSYLYLPEYLQQSREMVEQLQPQIRSSGGSASHWARLSLWLATPPFEVAIVGPDWQAKARQWWQRYDPNVLLMGGAEEGDLPLLQNKRVEGATMIYVCQDKVCKLPVEDNEVAFGLLE